MININLLPHHYKEQIKSRRFNLYLTSITTLVLFLIGITILGLFFGKLALDRQAKTVSREVEEKQQELSQYNQTKTLIESFNASIALSGQLIAKEVSWTNILSDLEAATPLNLKITKFEIGSGSNSSQSTQTASNQVKISGAAKDQREIVKFIVGLAEQPHFGSVKLISTATASEAKAKSYTFEASAQINEQGKE